MDEIPQVLTYILGGGLVSIIGVVAGYLLSAIDTRRKRDRLRNALYREIINMYETLRSITAAMGTKEQVGDTFTKEEGDLTKYASSIALWLYDALLRAESYEHAKSDLTLFYGLKDALAIEDTYQKYFLLRSPALITTLEKISLESRLDRLKMMCEDATKNVELQLKTGGLDKELLLKVSDPSIKERIAELIQFKPVKKKWYEFWKK